MSIDQASKSSSEQASSSEDHSAAAVASYRAEANRSSSSAADFSGSLPASAVVTPATGPIGAKGAIGSSAQPAPNRDSSDRRHDSAASSRTEPMEFRIIRDGAATRRLRLTGQRYTFGSGEGCSIRLRDVAVRPIHAVLIRDERRIVVRAYSVPVEVNGVRTTEATLVAGDVLRLGPYRLELLPALASDETSIFGDSTDPLAGFDPWQVYDAPRDAFRRSPARQHGSPLGADSVADDWVSQGRSATDELAWRKRLRQEVEQWRRRQSECDQREYRCDQREADLRERESELWSRAETLYRREYRLQSQEAAASQLYDEFDKRQKDLLRMREQTRGRDEQIREREAEFKKQEAEYQRQLDEAQRQLLQSQQQASTAATAVAQMRAEFAELSEQISQLSSRQEQIDQRDQVHRDERLRLQQELEQARVQAEQKTSAAKGQKETAESKRIAAEARVEELAAQLDRLRSNEADELQQQQGELQANEQLIADLRGQVDQLQQSLQNAQAESTQLRKDYELACQSILQLESLVKQSTARGDQDRESWAAEADELRASIDQLSIQLAQANGELSELTETNRKLTTQLAEMKAEREQLQSDRDQLQQEVETRPTHEAFATLQRDLEDANTQFSQMLDDYETTLKRLAAAEAQIHSAETQLSTAASAQLVDEPLNATENSSTQSLHHNNSVAEPVRQEETGTDASEHDEESLWPETEIELDADAATRPPDAPHATTSPTDFWEGADDDWQDPPSAAVQTTQRPEESVPDNRPDDQEESTFASQLIEQLNGETSDTSSLSNWDTPPIDETETDVDQPSTTDPALAWDMEYDQESTLGPWPDDEDYLQQPEEYPATEADDASRADAHTVGQWSDPNQAWSEVESGPIDPRPQAEAEAAIASPEGWCESDAGTPTETPSDEFQNHESRDDDSYHHDAPSYEPALEPEGTPQTENSGDEDLDPGDDDSIEAYMNRLLQRVQSPSDSAEPKSSSATLKATEPTDSEADSTSRLESENSTSNQFLAAEQIEKAVPIAADEPFLPRSSAPELNRDLSAMRRLANESADEAINFSVRNQTRDTQVKGMLNFVCAAGALVCGAACFHFIPGVIRYVAVAMTFIVAAVYVREGLQAILEAKTRLRLAEANRHVPEAEVKAEADDEQKAKANESAKL